jgi:hypothetical protein
MHKIALFLLIPTCVLSQTLDKQAATRFVQNLLWHRDSLGSWFDVASLEASRRLGIEYEGVDYKNLIAYDVEDSVRTIIRSQRLEYAITLDTLGEDCALLTLTFNRLSGKKQFYFKGKRCISSLSYLTRHWASTESEHFRIFVSDSSLLNPYGIDQLDLFVKRMAEALGLSEKDMQTLRRNKIYYYLCKDEDEIERLTGYRARGIYNLAYDAVISTFPNHLHELAHLLINFRLRHLPLYSHPFLQEGFAVAFGGRGGMASDVLMSVGSFLYRSQFVELSALFNKQEFDQLDASLSYPAVGLYNRFLVETRGMTSYLQLYRAHSGSVGATTTLRIASDELANDSAWQLYLQESGKNQAVEVDRTPNTARVLFEDSFSRVCEDSACYYFLLSDILLLPSDVAFRNYRSRVFNELMPARGYKGEKYLIRATRKDISVYNLLTNTLIASYAMSFALPPRQVSLMGDRYSFSIKKRVFDEPIRRLLNEVKHDGAGE